MAKEQLRATVQAVSWLRGQLAGSVLIAPSALVSAAAVGQVSWRLMWMWDMGGRLTVSVDPGLEAEVASGDFAGGECRDRCFQGLDADAKHVQPSWCWRP